MPRHKIFIQKGDPAVVGVRQYQYTGKHNRVDLLHFDVAKVSQLQSAVHKYDESLADGGGRAPIEQLALAFAPHAKSALADFANYPRTTPWPNLY